MRDAPLILIVEDETEIRLLMARVVEQMGCRVIGTNDGPSGAELMRSIRPDLLITDVVLPGLSGDELAKLADAMDVPVLRMSGEPETIETKEFGAVPFLRKPFRLAQLERMIEELLAKRR